MTLLDLKFMPLKLKLASSEILFGFRDFNKIGDEIFLNHLAQLPESAVARFNISSDFGTDGSCLS
jgi:hypothetical protein